VLGCDHRARLGSRTLFAGFGGADKSCGRQ
jgi:hypothetical protein